MLVCLLAAASGGVFAETQTVTEQNIGDAILERRTFTPEDLDSFDLNGDGQVDAADLVLHKTLNAGIVPSAAFEASSVRTVEGDRTIGVRLVFTKPFALPAVLSYKLHGTATYGLKAQGGDYTVAGYDTGASAGTIQVDAGADTAILSITIEDDAVYAEQTETLTVQLTGGSPTSYFLGAQQELTVYLDDNDGEWNAGLTFPDAGGYESFRLGITQEDGVLTGRVLANGSTIPTPQPGDANASGTDGWEATIYSGSQTLRIEIGPIPVDRTLSFFSTDRSRYYTIQIGPSTPNYRYDPSALFSGVVTQTLIPVQSRLGPVWNRAANLRREFTGTAVLVRQTSQTVVEEVTLQNVR